MMATFLFKRAYLKFLAGAKLFSPSFIGWGKSTHLGCSLPLALQAKVVRPEKIVVKVMGDAAFGASFFTGVLSGFN